MECYYDVKMVDVKKKGRWGFGEWGDWVMGIKKKKEKRYEDVEGDSTGHVVRNSVIPSCGDR